MHSNLNINLKRYIELNSNLYIHSHLFEKSGYKGEQTDVFSEKSLNGY